MPRPPRNPGVPRAPVQYFGSELRTHREAAGLPRSQLATKLGYSPQWLGQIEAGNRSPAEEFATDCDTSFKTSAGPAAVAGGAGTRALGDRDPASHPRRHLRRRRLKDPYRARPTWPPCATWPSLTYAPPEIPRSPPSAAPCPTTPSPLRSASNLACTSINEHRL
ncbi:helix-turn-helix domain-containing protein [Actinomadura hibisca]|uniref:helix-turn-helix domain-containing protein n=1 Tax=Actinomadura hibisca TaxID=68565 RepID=UPI000A0427D6